MKGDRKAKTNWFAKTFYFASLRYYWSPPHQVYLVSHLALLFYPSTSIFAKQFRWISQFTCLNWIAWFFILLPWAWLDQNMRKMSFISQFFFFRNKKVKRGEKRDTTSLGHTLVVFHYARNITHILAGIYKRKEVAWNGIFM